MEGQFQAEREKGQLEEQQRENDAEFADKLAAIQHSRDQYEAEGNADRARIEAEGKAAMAITVAESKAFMARMEA